MHEGLGTKVSATDSKLFIVPYLEYNYLKMCSGSSKCIARARICDGIEDCWGGSDEQVNSASICFIQSPSDRQYTQFKVAMLVFSRTAHVQIAGRIVRFAAMANAFENRKCATDVSIARFISLFLIYII